MKFHNFILSARITHRDPYYDQFKFGFGTFGIDDALDIFIWFSAIPEWCEASCVGEYTIIDTSSSYANNGVKDVSVIAFVEEIDAVQFKLRWDNVKD